MYSKISVLIVEDEPLIAETIKTYLLPLNLKDIQIEYEFATAIKSLNQSSFDLVLLDVRMKGLYDGIELGAVLSEREIPFMYITAHSDLEMIKKMTSTKASAFISKPLRKEELLINVTFILNAILENNKNILNLKSGYDLIPVEKKKFLYLKSDGNYLELYLNNGEKVLIRTSIERFLEENPDSDFLQTHRSYVLNRDKIKLIKTDSIILVSDHIVPISRTFQPHVRSILSKN